MNEKELILDAMRKAGEPLNAGKAAELTGLDRKVAEARLRDSVLQRRIARALKRSRQPEITPLSGDRTLVLDKGGK